MTIDTPALPASYGWGFVVGQIIEAIADQSGDSDRFPESRPVSGSVVFEPLTPLRKVSTPVALFVAHKNVVAALNDNGEIIDADGYPGVWLVTGSYRVSFKLVDAEIKAFNIEVTSAHTIPQPLNLATAAPYVPEDGAAPVLVPVPAGTSVGSTLIWTADGLAWGSGAEPVRRVTLAGAHAVDTSTWNKAAAQTVVFVQGGAGGHPVYHQDAPVDVAAAGATVTAWVWTGTAWRWFSDAAPASLVIDETPPTAGTLQLSAAPTEIVATSAAAMDETALHPQPYRFAIAPASTSASWSDTQWQAAMGPWQESKTATLTGLTMGTVYNARCEVRDMAGNTRLTAVVSATTTVVVDPVTLYEATFTAPDGTLLTDYTPEVGTPPFTHSGGPGKIFDNAVWGIPNPEWHSQPGVSFTTAPLKFIRWTFDYDLSVGDNYASVWIEMNSYSGFGLSRASGVLSGGAFGGTMVSSEVSPTAPTIPLVGRAIVELEGTPGIVSNWMHRFYIVVDGEPVLHTTEVVTVNRAGTLHRWSLGSAPANGGVEGVYGTKLDRIELEGVPL